MNASLPLSTPQRRIVWGVRILLALAFGAAGISKLASVPQMVLVFDAVGFGQWFRYLTGRPQWCWGCCPPSLLGGGVQRL